MLDKDQIEDWDGEAGGDPDAKRKAPVAPKPNKPVATSTPDAPVVAMANESGAPDDRPTPMAASTQQAPALPVQPVETRHSGEAHATGEHVTLTPEEARARKRRSQWTALALFAFVILVFVITMARLGGGIPERL